MKTNPALVPLENCLSFRNKFPFNSIKFKYNILVTVNIDKNMLTATS